MDTGSWINSSKNVKISGNKVSCMLKDKKGKWIYNEVQLSDKYKYHNNDGRFQWVVDNSLKFMIINMEKNKDRWKKIISSFKEIQKTVNIEFTRIEGVDGKNMDNDEYVNKLLNNSNLIGQKLNHIESKTEWIYDGTVSKSFPGLSLNGHMGTKGLTVSNMKCFDEIQKNNSYNWYCILEDDSEINNNTYKKIIDTIRRDNNNSEIILLDERGFGGACAMLYNQRIIKHIREHMHPLSNFSINNEKNRCPNLWDWKLWSYIDHFGIKYKIQEFVKSGSFKSEIS